MAYIKALAPITNSVRLSHLDGNRLARGEVTQVPSHYAEQLARRGHVEILPPDEVEGELGGDPSEDESSEQGSPDEGSPDEGGSGEGSPGKCWSLGEHCASGYYYALFGGERTEDPESDTGYATVGRGKDEAQAEIDRRNELGVRPNSE